MRRHRLGGAQVAQDRTALGQAETAVLGHRGQRGAGDGARRGAAGLEERQAAGVTVTASCSLPHANCTSPVPQPNQTLDRTAQPGWGRKAAAPMESIPTCSAGTLPSGLIARKGGACCCRLPRFTTTSSNGTPAALQKGGGGTEQGGRRPGAAGRARGGGGGSGCCRPGGSRMQPTHLQKMRQLLEGWLMRSANSFSSLAAMASASAGGGGERSGGSSKRPQRALMQLRRDARDADGSAGAAEATEARVGCLKRRTGAATACPAAETLNERSQTQWHAAGRLRYPAPARPGHSAAATRLAAQHGPGAPPSHIQLPGFYTRVGCKQHRCTGKQLKMEGASAAGHAAAAA